MYEKWKENKTKHRKNL